MAINTTHRSASRRAFLQSALAAAGVSLCATSVASILASCEVDETLPTVPAGEVVRFSIAGIEALQTVGGIISTVVPGVNFDREVFIARVGPTNFVVFSTVCTHQGCPLPVPSNADAASRIVCPCHAAEYQASTGRITRQPMGDTATDLPTFAATYESASQVLVIATS
jgi:Rieske Fe-S protein